MMNHGTILQQNSRRVAHVVSVHVCSIHEPWNHCLPIIEGDTCNAGSFLFLLILVLNMDHGTMSNRQIVWQGLTNTTASCNYLPEVST